MFARSLAPLLLLMLTLSSPAVAQPPDTVWLDELTWPEVRDKIKSGTTTAIVATAGTEQNGPHMVLGKHKFIIAAAAEQIARKLGNALIAPIVTYVPEGNLRPLSGHMRFPGAITLPNEHFMKLLAFTARSLAVHGFTDIVFIGDSGGNQRGMEEVSRRLNKRWATEPARAHFIGDYYANNGFRQWLALQGETADNIGRHAGISDTSELLAVAPEHIRLNKLAPQGGFDGSGVSGDPTRASVAYGQKGIALKVKAAVKQINVLIRSRE